MAYSLLLLRAINDIGLKTMLRRFTAHIIALVVFLLAINLQSQSVIIERVDVDSSRAGIVTAGYGFEVAISMEGIENVNNVSFKLVYDNADVIFFSEYQLADFEDEDNVFIKPPKPGEGALTVAAFSGQTLKESDLDDPEVITLRFTVAKAAPNGTEVTFRMENAFATSYVDSVGGESIELSGEEFSFTIHGFVEVWPGDANQDGTVDPADQNTIGLYLGEGSLSPNMRAFKRGAPSTRFYPQRVLLWDAPALTHADCDGDGDITVEDGMVVFLNEGKVVGQSDAGLINPNIEHTSQIIYSPEFSFVPKGEQIKNSFNTSAIELDSDKAWKSIVVTLENPSNNQLLEIEKGSEMGAGFSALAHQRDGEIEILIGEYGSEAKARNGEIAVLSFAEGEMPVVKSIKAMSASGTVFEISPISSVDESADITALKEILSKKPSASATLFDVQGRVIAKGALSSIYSRAASYNTLLFLQVEGKVFKVIGS